MCKTFRNLLAILALVSIVLSACSGTAPTTESSIPSDLITLQAVGFGEILVSEAELGDTEYTQSMFVPGITTPIGYTAIRVFNSISLAESGYLVASAPAMTAADAVLLVTSLAIGNTVQNVTEGRNLVLRVEHPDGTIGYWEVNQTGQIVNQVTAYNVTATDSVQEGADVNANVRSQCAETGQNCQATPGPAKLAAVFGDEGDSGEVAILSLWGFQATLFLDHVTLLSSPANYDLIVIRAGKQGVRLVEIPAIRARWPMAKIVVMSGGNFELDAKAAGADGFVKSEKGPEAMLALLRSLGLVP